MTAPDVTLKSLTELGEGLKESYHGFCVYLKRDLDKYIKDKDLKSLYKSMFKECKDNKGKLISLSPLLKEIKEPLKEVKKVFKHKYK